MRSSSRNRSLVPCFFVFVLASCVTSSYRVAARDGDKVELEVTPDRIVLQCEHASENEEIPYGFMIHVLDEAKTVLNVVQTNTLSRADCFGRVEKVSRILRAGKKIYIAGIGNIDSSRRAEVWKYIFPQIGAFNGNGRILQFYVIANEFGDCFHAYEGETPPCPRDEFPISGNR